MKITGVRTHILIAGTQILRCPECRIEYARHAHLSMAEILLPDPLGELFRHFKPEDRVIVRLGYRDQEPDEWQGSLTKIAPYSKKDQILVRAVGLERPLTDTRIIQAWEKETPESIIAWAIGQAGMPVGRIESPGVVFPRFIASNIPVWQIARQCEHTCSRGFGLDLRDWSLWMDRSGRVNWGAHDEKAALPEIETGTTLIRHLPAPALQLGVSLVETFLIPGFKRCMKFRLKDRIRGHDAVHSALAVRHISTSHSVRTFIWFGDTYEKY